MLGVGLLVAGGAVLAFSGEAKAKPLPPPGVDPSPKKVPPPGVDPGVVAITGNVPGVSGGGPEVVGFGQPSAPSESSDVTPIGPDSGGLGMAQGVVEAFGNGD